VQPLSSRTRRIECQYLSAKLAGHTVLLLVTLLVIVTRLMSLELSRHANHPGDRAHLVAMSIVAVVILLVSFGCEELDARRNIQEANRLYQGGQFQDAAKLYREAIAKAPHIDIAYYNAALNQLKIFRPGVETKENIEAADGVTSLFSKWLEMHPGDDAVIGIMTQVWLDAGQFDKAIEYWERELNKDRKNTEIIGILAGINRQAGRWDKAVEMYYLQADAETEDGARGNAYLSVSKMAANRLFDRTEIFGDERIRVADIGIEALQTAAPLLKDNPDVETYTGVVYSLRSEAHQASWAQAIDKYSGHYHHSRAAALRKAQQPADANQQPAADGDDATDEGGTPDGEEKTPAPEGDNAAPKDDNTAGAAAPN